MAKDIDASRHSFRLANHKSPGRWRHHGILCSSQPQSMGQILVRLWLGQGSQMATNRHSIRDLTKIWRQQPPAELGLTHQDYLQEL